MVSVAFASANSKLCGLPIIFFKLLRNCFLIEFPIFILALDPSNVVLILTLRNASFNNVNVICVFLFSSFRGFIFRSSSMFVYLNDSIIFFFQSVFGFGQKINRKFFSRVFFFEFFNLDLIFFFRSGNTQI